MIPDIKRTARAGFILVLAAGCAPVSTGIVPATATLPLKYAGPATSAAITAGDLMTRLYIFADDSMLGRRTGDAGNLRGTAYIEREVRKLGLVPAGENGTFFQDVPLIRRVPVVSLRIGSDSLDSNTDYFVVDPLGPIRNFTGLPAIYAGEAAKGEANLISREQAEGKIVVVKGFATSVLPMLRRAAAIIYVDDATFAQAIRRGRRNVMLNPTLDTAQLPAPFIVPTATASRLFGIPFDSVRPGTVGKPITGTLSFSQLKLPARNVVAVIPGSDPQLKGQYVALGAHNDHLGLRTLGPLDHDSVRAYNEANEKLVMARTGLIPGVPGGSSTSEERASIRVNVDSLRRNRPARLDSVYNGADDDGSGSMGLLEIAEYYARSGVKPGRSLLFVWHMGEESGLLGSRWFTDHPTVPLDSIVAQINNDMIGRGPGSMRGKTNRFVQLLGTRRISRELGDIVDAVNSKPLHMLEFDYTFDVPGHPERLYCRSDHWNYARVGIPIAYLSDGNHVDYHQLTDEAQYIDYAQYARVVLLTQNIVQTIANLDHRLKVDKPRPAANAVCIQ